MRIRFQAEPTGGLRIIRELENYPICWLEGRNGVGKTLAVNLLDLATGGQPYAAETAAWLSLRANLNRVTITIDNLHDGDQLEIILTPDAWPEEPLLVIPNLGTAALNGEPVSFSRVHAELRVFRISGDETLTDRLRSLISRDRANIQRQGAQLNLQLDKLTEFFRQHFQPFLDLSEATLANLDAAISRLTVEVDAAIRDFEQRKHISSRLENLKNLVQALDNLQTNGSTVEASLAEVEAEAINLEDKRSELERRREKLAPANAQMNHTTSELERLYKLRQKQIREWQAAFTAAREVLEPIMDIPGITEALRLESDLRRRRDDLERQRASLTYPRGLRPLIDRIRESLDRELDPELDSAVVAILPDAQVTPSKLRSGLQVREDQLRKQDPQVNELDITLGNIDQELEQLQRGIAHLRKMDSAKRRSEDSEKRIQDVLARLDSGNEYKSVMEELGNINALYVDAVKRHAEAVVENRNLHLLGDEEELNAQIKAIQNELSLSEALDAAIEHAALAVGRARQRLEDAQAELAMQRELHQATYDKLSTFVRLLHQGDAFAWLRDTYKELLPHPEHPPSQSIVMAERLIHRIRGFLDDAERIVLDTGILGDALQNLASRLDRPSPDAMLDVRNPFIEPMVRYYEDKFGALLRSPEIQKALFEGGSFEDFDLLRREVTWRTPTMELRRRPIEAFSSGERAFTYVLATVLQLQQNSERARNRLLVLDEFGAFIEADRLDRLVGFLTDQLLGAGIADQVVIILPLRRRTKSLETADEARLKTNGYLMYKDVANVQ